MFLSLVSSISCSCTTSGWPKSTTGLSESDFGLSESTLGLILLSFKLRNLLKGVGQIVEWSIRDESLHSEAGCWLFRQLMLEKPELNTPELRKSIEEAALLSLKLELDFIDKVYEMGDLEGCSKYDLVSFIKFRVNTKMQDLGYGPIVNGIDDASIKRMKWFDSLSAGKQHTDFFASRVTNYSKGVQNWDANDLF